MRNKLKSKMKDKGVKVEELAVILNCTKDYVYKIIAGTRTPIMGDAKTIAVYLNDTVDNLFFNDQLYDSSIEQTATKEPA